MGLGFGVEIQGGGGSEGAKVARCKVIAKDERLGLGLELS